MKTAKELKEYVFSRLNGCWGELCTIFCLSVGGVSVFVLAFLLIVGLLERSGKISTYPGSLLRYGLAVPVIFLAALILLTVAATPFIYGTGWYRIQQIRGVSVHARSIFSCYTSFRKLWQVLCLNSILIIRRLYIIVPFAGISACGFYISGLIEKDSGRTAAYYAVFLLTVSVTLCMICLFALYNVRFEAVLYLYVLEPNKSPYELISESKRIMRGKALYMAKIMLSLAGWLIPCIIIFPMIFILPYIHMIHTAAVNEIIMYESGEEHRNDRADAPEK